MTVKPSRAAWEASRRPPTTLPRTSRRRRRAPSASPSSTPPGKGSYPISGTTWAVVKVKQPADKAKALKGFFHWAIHDGQTAAAELKYAPLPASIVELADKKIDRIGE